MSKTPIKVLRKKNFSSSDDSTVQNLMRRTRSSTISDLSPKYSRRSLRSGQSEKFSEIPTVFQSRTSHTVPATNKTPRRSNRFANSSENKVDHEDHTVCRSRKRRFQSCPVNTGSATKSHNSPSKEVNGSNAGPIKKKSVFETEIHCEDLEKGRRSKVDSDIPEYNNICNGSSETVMKDDSSPTEGSEALTDSTKSSNTDCNSQGMNSESPVHLLVNASESNCTCLVTQNRITSEKSESCGKRCVQTIQANNLMTCSVKSPAAENVVSLTNGTRSMRLNSNSSLGSSPVGASSPRTAEEANSKLSPNSKVNSSPHLRRSRRLSEKCDSTAHDTEASCTTSKRTNSNHHEDSETDRLAIKKEAIDVDCNTKIPVVQKNSSGSMQEHCHQVQSYNDTKETSIKTSQNQEKEECRKVPDAGKISSGSLKHSLLAEDALTYDSIEYAGFSDDDVDFSFVERKKRKMNLRSSGVVCDPDFYTLSLDLMIKRNHRRHLLEADAFAETTHTQIDSNQTMNLMQDTSGKETTETDTRIEETEFEDDVAQITILDPKDENNETPKIFTKFPPELTALHSKEASSGIGTTPTDPDENRLASVTDSKFLPTASTHQGNLKRHALMGLPKVISKGKNRGPRGLVNSKLDKSSLSGSRSSLVSVPAEPPPLFTEDPPSGPDVYYFESDHVALKHNQDYHNLLHAVAKLEAQQHQILKDIETLDVEKVRAIDEPIAFVKKLQKNEKLNFPHPVNIPDLPTLDWAKYTSVYGTFDHVFSNDTASPKKPVTRKKKINFETGVPRLSLNSPSSSKTNSNGKADPSSSSEANRSNTFKMAWTCEEQNKLEELLMKYPTEEIEFNRYRKIAAAFGNRTPLQVQSRVQKYFLKLAKAGLPIPGRMPRIERIIGSRNKKARPHPHQSLTRMSTFFPTFHVPVRMKEDEADGEGLASSSNLDDDGDGWSIGHDQVSDEEDIAEEMRYSDEYLEILRLKRLRREKLRVFDQTGRQALAKHIGFECDMCNCDPIEGVRYHCIDCPTEDGVDLCQSCIRCQGQFETETHKPSHRLEPVYKADNFTDNDYMRFLSLSGEYNYLDPNFLPPAT